MRLSRFQRGYLYEIPLLLLVFVLALALILPRLSVFGQKVLIGVSIVPILYCLFYLIVRHGWIASRIQRNRRHVRLAIFLACAIAAVATIALMAVFILR
jgi:hypothetical protein